MLFFVAPKFCLCSLDLSTLKKTDNPHRVAIIGSGYVGLVSGGGLAELGHKVVCVDIDQGKINKLTNGIMPIYEPGLNEMIGRNLQEQRLFFSSDIAQAIRESDIIITAVGTPMSENGEADLSALASVVQSLVDNLNGYKIICTKSTVPIGTNRKIKELLIEKLGGHTDFDVVSNPEFLREGCALQDFFHCNPVVLGSDSANALVVMEQLYKPLTDTGTTLIKTDLTSAETIKYAWNSYSMVKIAYVNQLSHLCNATGADVATVVKGMSFGEKLLPIGTVRPGAGIGGSCLPKDTAALIAMSKNFGVDVGIVRAARQADEDHKQTIIKEFYGLLDNSVKDKKIAVLGLSFKANTDDIRYSPAIDMLQKLIADGAHVYAYDPQAMNNMQKLIPTVHYCSSADEALNHADALLLLTEWAVFKNMDMSHVASLMAHPIVMDARNMWDPAVLTQFNFKFKNLGRKLAL